METRQGNLSINSENIFPIIQKWLYSDRDIFIRELISNGCDAISKLNKLSLMGEYTLPEEYAPAIQVEVNDEEKTISFTDNGLGMTADEVDKYINQIAFSGAKDFLEKYKDKATEDQIIGHFGLGFYSAFMVSDRVTIDSLSWQEGAEAVHWESDSGMDFSMEASDRTKVGTTITLYLNDDAAEFANEFRAREILDKYCAFMPVEIYLRKAGAEPEYEEVETDEKDAEGKPVKEKVLKAPTPVNDIHPLWTKHPNDCTDDEYKDFYRKVFNDFKEPLFWIHLNMDYPFNLKGILYFPRINMEYESIEGTIKLYSNQVFIADNIKEVIPEFLMLLKGVIDCPDLPLNVSRSALQNDGFVTRISEYISKKVADKLAGMCRTDRENYEKYWDDISPFIKYGCLRDDKFCKKMTDYILFKDLDGKYHTLPDALEVNKIDDEAEEDAESKENAAEGEASEGLEKVEGEIVDENSSAVSGDGEEAGEEKKQDRTIYYVTDAQQQSQYINLFRAHGMQAFLLENTIDQPFMQQLEAKNEGVHFSRIDADVQDSLKSRVGKKAAEEMKEDGEKLEKLIRGVLKNDKIAVRLEKLKDKKISSMLTIDEQSRRFSDMMKMYAKSGMGMGSVGEGKEGQTLILNANHPLVKYVLSHEEDKNVKMICRQLYDLAQIQNAPLSAEDMASFIERSNEIMMVLAQE